MGRKPCCTKQGLNRGTWSAQEDKDLINYIQIHGQGKWRDLPLKAGLNRCGKSCRLRWLNYLRPDIKRGNISSEEDELIIRLHKLLGNRWSLIARRLPGRTDNEIKNYWNTNLSKRKKLGTDHKSMQKLKLHKPENINGSNSEESSIAAEPHRVIRTKAVRCTKVVIIPGSHDCNYQTADYHNVGANDHQIFYENDDHHDLKLADGDHLHHHRGLECSNFSHEAMFEVLMDGRTTRLSDPFENNDHMMHLKSFDYFLNS